MEIRSERFTAILFHPGETKFFEFSLEMALLSNAIFLNKLTY